MTFMNFCQSRPLLNQLQIKIRGEVDYTAPGIYLWDFGDTSFGSGGELLGKYGGKAKSFKRRLPQYERNIRRMGEGKKYRQNPFIYRNVHYALAIAEHQRRLKDVTLTLIANGKICELGILEAIYIAEELSRLNGFREPLLRAEVNNWFPNV